ncbi:hypothetical protein BLA28_13995 [Eisenbergiella tayi]|uniref:SGNH hydrolase-type esterase domain-containing protein n=1 Tax=Eisenbergiella tayi TaxID=1432052 RepID=A0A1E3ANW3_9FIRM|nr:GDSL-type esterase/lipase family protein [Eisenbergiella tayi]ODM10390.1 hypothetical protein BEH84_04762 [Eisenbergiella tayi]OIZ64435.1 hypothetical protein BLA28_13995 [Eisenbergiella tayi]
MIFQGIDFHNVDSLVRQSQGYAMQRVPDSVRLQLNENARDEVRFNSTGVELRFKIKSEKAVLSLKAEPGSEAMTAFIYYGSFQGGWQNSSKAIGVQETRISIPRPGDPEILQKLTGDCGLPFNPEVIRVVLPYGRCLFLGIEGDVEPPEQGDLPDKTYLAYGSSITHGSLALAAPCTYPFRIAQKLGCDYLNLGYAGSAYLEKEMAEYIVSRKDWDFASVEMGINMLYGNFTADQFEERVRSFVEVFSREERPVFATSIFGFNGSREFQEKAALFRKIVKKYAGEKLIFTDGLELLDNPAWISEDLIHPAVDGILQIADRWSDVMKKYGV